MYEALKSRKENGELLEWENITYEILHQLSLVESIPDSMIGDLYGVTKETVRNKRYKWNLKITGANLLFAQLFK